MAAKKTTAARKPAAKKPAAKKPAAKKPASRKAAPRKATAVAPRVSTRVRPAPSAPTAPPPAPAPPPVDHAARVGELWRRLSDWVAMTGAPSLSLAPGAAEKAIAAAEKAMKLRFPPDFRASLACCDGQTAGDGPPFPWMPGCGPLAPLARIVEAWKDEQEPARKKAPKQETLEAGDRLKAGVHRSGRIPIAGLDDRRGERTFLDLDPGPAGTVGQLVTLVSKTDLVVIDASFTAAFERWVNVLERGLWTYDRERHVVHPRALAPATSHAAGLFSRR